MPGSTPCISHKLPIIISLICLSFLISSCTPAAEVTTVEGFFFDTFISIVIYDPCDADVTDGCIELCSHYDNLFSKSIPESDIYRINHSSGIPVSVSEDTVFLLSEAIRYAELTDGKIDPTIETVGSLWDFHPSDTPELPDEAEVANALTHVDYHNIRITQTQMDAADHNLTIDDLPIDDFITDPAVTLTDPESSLDLAFLAKGYIADRIKEYLLANGIQNAIINLGGNTVVLGSKPGNEPFTVGVEKPFGDGVPIASFALTDCTLVTSGVYHRCFYDGETLYHHILDTATGYPVENHLYSVSILGESSLTCDALSTTCFVLGPEDGMKLIETLDGVEAMFIMDDDSIRYSSGFPEPLSEY